ncbi:DEAD/DEAH box helicase [Micromonospora sagamiensis]|uniref:Helicase-like protein n=1 Tax=Micromonospora sagamiensis TaxID=47875 RepID=A0A562WL43_9ACTN|nr:DEAD/DEAH box helicase [Micromonospora sagamiensis]TWJ30916.1 helicase-like protein [Micromonospora sagamiensis]BCL16045.1 helicase SNF2 [Micromonospora sagamiensis]
MRLFGGRGTTGPKTDSRTPARFDRRAARECCRRGRRLAERLGALEPLRAGAGQEAARQYRQAHQALVVERLRTMPLQELRSAAVQGLRLVPSVERAGYRDVLSVLNASPADLLRLPGVGERTAAAMRQAATNLYRHVDQDTVVRLDADRRPAALEPLLRALRVLHALNRLMRDNRSIVGPLLADLTDALRRAEPATRWWAQLLAGADAKATARAAVGDVQRLLTDSRAQAAGELLTNVERAIADAATVDHRELWADYVRHAAAYHTLLAQVGGPTTDDAPAHGYLPRPVQDRADQIVLDQSRLRVTLRGYQAFGARYALAQRRCILGDEMGLGKTIEAIAVCAHLAANGERHFLVICPASVVVNWLGEVALHSTLTAHRLHGPERDQAIAHWYSSGGVGVTTYETLSRLALPADLRPGLVVVDEAQYVKNPRALRSQAVAAWIAVAPRVVFLTGTPMINRVDEFRQLIGYLNPSLAASITVTDGLAGAPAFRRKVADVYLRRNQKDVLTELPELIEVEDWVEMERAEAETYRRAVETRNFPGMRRATVVPDGPVRSAKLDRLREIVQESADNGGKVLIFSYFLETLDRVHQSLDRSPRFLLTGKVPPAARQQLVDEFSAAEGHAVLISQIQVGGVGLNVPAASVVVLTEPQLTPTAEEQAIARCHRMGQTRRVRVHRLLAKDTVDQRLLEILGHKTALIRAYAKESVAKAAHPLATDSRYIDQSLLHDSAIPIDQRIIMVERQRLGIDGRRSDRR